MQKRWLPGSMFVLATAIILHVGCQGQSIPKVFSTPTPNHPSSSPTPLSASTTVPLSANTSLQVPAVGGFSGSFKESGGVAAGATVNLTSYAASPASAPVPLAISRRSSSSQGGSSVGNAIFWVSQKYSMPMTLATFPTTTWQLPANLITAGPFELETIDATTGLLMDTEVDTGVTGNVVSFPGGAAPFATVSSHTYWWELITGFASPPPPGCGSNSSTVTINPAGQSISEPTLCDFTGSLQISSNNAPSGISMYVFSDVPALASPDGPAAPPGTTTGLVSVAADVAAAAVTFNSGFFGLSVRLPSSIPAAGKSFFVTACTIEKRGTAYMGCIDAPTVSGPLSVTGQTVSYAGLTSAYSLPVSNTADACHKFCPPKKFYYYTASLYY